MELADELEDPGKEAEESPVDEEASRIRKRTKIPTA